MKRADVLELARRAVTVDRAATHGAPEDTFEMIAALWSPIVARREALSSADVCLMLGLLKVARAVGNPGHADNWVDLAGYAACGAEVAAAAGGSVWGADDVA